MPNVFPTPADLVAHAFGVDQTLGNDLLQSTPFLALLPMIPSSNGEWHSWVKRVGAPTAGWRTVNNGRLLSKSTRLKVDAQLKILDWSFEMDQATPIVSPTRSAEAFLLEEGFEQLADALVKYEDQVINGQLAGAAGGINGFRDAETILYSDSPMVVDATGTTVGGASSVYAVRVGDRGVRGVYKGQGTPFDIGQTVAIKATKEGTDPPETYPAWYTPCFAWLGLEIKDRFALGRICNLTEQDDKTLTDTHISRLLAKFPVGRGPTHLIMSRRSHQQLQDSRTATNPTGAPAPFPTESFGIPIVLSDNVKDTEAVLTPEP